MAKKRKSRRLKISKATAAKARKKHRTKRKAKAAPKALKKSTNRKATIARTIPTLVKDRFVITSQTPIAVDPVTGEASGDELWFLNGDKGDFVVPLDKNVRMFDTKEAAQAVVDEALIMADEGSMWRRAEVEKATKYLHDFYQFSTVPTDPGDYLLTVEAKPLTDSYADRCTFAQAKAKLHVNLKSAVKVATVELNRFEKMWG